MLTPADHELLSDLLDDRLDGEQEALAAGRLEREPELRAAWDDLVRLRALMRDLPVPPAPADFVARVRARRQAARDSDVEGDAEERPPVPLRALPRPQRPHGAEAAAAPASAPSAPAGTGPGAEPIPLFWRRLMTVAYAAAALLVVGIGLMAVQDRKRDGREAAPGRPSLETAGLSREESRDGGSRQAGERAVDQLGGASKQDLDKRKQPGREDAEQEKKLERDADTLAAQPDDNRVPEAASEAPPPPAGSAEGGALTGFAGPGGRVPPRLRAPSDVPAPAPGSPPPGSSKERSGLKDAPRPGQPPAPTDAPAPAGPAPAAAAPADAPAADAAPAAVPRSAGAPPAPILLVLEAASLAEGRALLASTTAGPGLTKRSAAPKEAEPARGPAAGGGGGGASPADRLAPYQEVRLRLLAAADQPVVARLPAAERERLRGLPEPPRDSAAAPLGTAGRAGGLSGGLPPASPSAPAAPLPTPAPAPTSGPAPASLAEPLGVLSLELSAQELARLESLVGLGAFGPWAPASAAAPSAAGGPARASEASPRRSVRVLVLRAAPR